MKRLFSLPLLFAMLASILAAHVVSAQTQFTVEVKGKGQPIIFIHGLYGSSAVWDGVIDHYQKKYECHMITLAGFGGHAASLNDHFLASVKDDLIKYVKDRKLKKPTLIGHSMGAFLSLWAASSASDVFGKVIAVDGAPFLPALIQPTATVESGRAMAEQIKAGMTQRNSVEADQNMSMMLSSMITSQENIDRAMTIAAKADVATQAEVMYEMYTTDLRPAMASVKNPVLVMGAWIAYKNYGVTHELTSQHYSEQMAAAKNVKVEITDTAKHFIFYDDPAWFTEKVDAFLLSEL